MENQSKVITIEKVESQMFDNGGTQYKVTAGGAKYKFNDQTKPDEEGKSRPTVAFQQFKDMGLKVGSTVEIWYKEQEKEYQGKPYTDRLIASFRETNGQPVKPIPKANTYHKDQTEAPDWDNIAVGKCQTVFLQAFIESGHSFMEAKQQVVQARQLAELVVFGKQSATEELPTIQHEAVQVEDIPF